jgi:DNA-binding NarL/FixJ family response regulator
VADSSSNGASAAVIRVLIADDHALVRSGLRMLLEDEAGVEVVGEAGDGAQALVLAKRLLPTVILADISMPPPDGIELARLLCRDLPAIKTIIVSMHEDPGTVEDALNAGAAGYVVKRSGPSELLQAIRDVAGGRPYLDTCVRFRHGLPHRLDIVPRFNQ